MKKPIKFIPAKPCCDSCVLEALTTAGFDYTEPFVVVSGAAGRSKRSRAALLESILEMSGDVVILVSSPAAKTEDVPKPAEADLGDVSALGESTMRQILGVTEACEEAQS